jgi:hypothetical protein
MAVTYQKAQKKTRTMKMRMMNKKIKKLKERKTLTRDCSIMMKPVISKMLKLLMSSRM